VAFVAFARDPAGMELAKATTSKFSGNPKGFSGFGKDG
jgi:hypothetical protein